jgi:diguanylate cyclase (GGDEF)-like protein
MSAARALRRLVLGAALLAQPAVGQPTLPAATGNAGDPYAELRAIEPLVWRDSWQARRELEARAANYAEAAAAPRAAYYLLLARALTCLNDPEPFDNAVREGLAAAADLASDSPLTLRLRVLDGVGATNRGDYATARELLSATVTLARAAGETGIAVLGAAELGFALSLAGNHESAQLELQRAHGEAVALRDEFLIASVNEVFGTLYTYIDEYGNALSHYRQALRGYQQLGYEVYQAEAIYGIAVAQREAGEYEAALANFQRYGEITGRHGDLHGEFDTAYGLASTYGDMGDCERALPAIDRALALEGPEDYKAELLKHAAVCHARGGDGAAARQALQRATAIIGAIEELRGTRWEIDLQRAQAEMLAALGDYQGAYTALRDFHRERIALLETNASQRRVSQRATLENIRQNLQIDLLQEQARVRELELERQQQGLRTQRLANLFAVFAVLVAVGIVVWRLRDTHRLRELSNRDPLTGLANRRRIFARLEELLAGRQPGTTQLSLLLLDIDDFKTLNDRYGHPSGDAALQAVAGALRAALRPGDEVARVGGEEFLVVLPRTAASGAQEVAERILARIRELRIGDPQLGLGVTASLGVAVFGVHGNNIDALYSAADRALYGAKRSGKDRVEYAAAAQH